MLLKDFNITDFAPAIIARCNQLQADLIGNSRFKFIPSQDTPRALAVAHVDTVFDDEPAVATKREKVKVTNNGRSYFRDSYSRKLQPVRQPSPDCIYSGALDDRLGVAILLDILPVIMPDFKYDVLLTTDEEIGQSTASDWLHSIDDKSLERASDYQFVFEFDRAGTDVVTYDFHNHVAEQLLEDSGWRIGLGAFTDICDLIGLGVWAANFGCGYHNQHTNSCYVDLHDLEINLRRFALFVHKLGTDILDDMPKQKSSGKWYNYRDDYYHDITDPNDAENNPFYANETYLGDWGNYVNEDDDDDDADCDVYIGPDGRVTDSTGKTIGLEDDRFSEMDKTDSPSDEDFHGLRTR